MQHFEWKPNKGERDSDYTLRVFNENPTLTLPKIMAAQARAHMSNLGLPLRQALESPAPAPKPKVKFDVVVKRDVDLVLRELQLEAQVAIIKLERDSLRERVANLQRMCKEQHEELAAIRQAAPRQS